MKLITANSQITFPQEMNVDSWRESVYRQIEMAGRTCYKSELSYNVQGAEQFVRKVVKAGHGAMLEHASITVRFTVDRGITHELVRHRIASFAQESTRYCNYSSDKFGNSVTFIDLRPGMDEDPVVSILPKETFDAIYAEWQAACEDAERHYLAMIKMGATPQIARSVLPNSVKSEIIVTANIREWRNILSLRALGTTGKPHPQMTEVMKPLLDRLAGMLPACFDDLKV